MDAKTAAELLGIKRQTLYAYVSRGRVRTAPVEGSRARAYLRSDLLRIKARRDARSGHGAVAAGALRWGEPVLDSAITAIDSGGHRYRGHSCIELAQRGTTYEQVAELLWTGDLPATTPNWQVRSFAASAARLASLLPKRASPLDACALALPALGTIDPERFDMSVSAVLRRGRRLLRRLAAALALSRGPAAVTAALDAGSVSRALLVAFGAKTGAGAVAAIERALVLCADHELNPSSFSARVTASAGADLHACVASALATLSGPLHGGGCDRVEALVSEVEQPERGVKVVRARLRLGESLAGFGHRLYPGGDPRARLLLSEPVVVRSRVRKVRVLTALVDAMGLGSDEEPTVDIGLVALASALRLPTGAAKAIFGVGRAAGWIAHVLEQRQAGFLLRPRARYVGPADRESMG